MEFIINISLDGFKTVIILGIENKNMRALDFFVNEYTTIAKLKHRKHRLSLSLSSATATCADALSLSRASSRFAIQRLLFYLVSVSDFSLGSAPTALPPLS